MTDPGIGCPDRTGVLCPQLSALPIVVAKAEGVWVEDPEGNRYMDMLSLLFSPQPGTPASQDYSGRRRP